MKGLSSSYFHNLAPYLLSHVPTRRTYLRDVFGMRGGSIGSDGTRPSLTLKRQNPTRKSLTRQSLTSPCSSKQHGDRRVNAGGEEGIESRTNKETCWDIRIARASRVGQAVAVVLFGGFGERVAA